jgi:hypothetical protein
LLFAGPASARHHPRWPPGPAPAAGPLVNFNRGALFTCSGALGGVATTDTANITATATRVTAVVTVRGTPFTTVFGNLTTSARGICGAQQFFTVTVGATGVGTTTVSVARGAGTTGAFAWFNRPGLFGVTLEVTPLVSF